MTEHKNSPTDSLTELDLDPSTSVQERQQLIEVCKSDLYKMEKEQRDFMNAMVDALMQPNRPEQFQHDQEKDDFYRHIVGQISTFLHMLQ